MALAFSNGWPAAFTSAKPESMAKYELTKDGQWTRKHVTSDIKLKTNVSPYDEAVVVYDDLGVKQQHPDAFTIWKQGPVIKALIIRLLLIGHNVLAVWRVVKAYEDEYYWLLAIMNVFLFVEGIIVIARRRGTDYKWWCPCFLIYLSTTLPALWLLILYEFHPDLVRPGQAPPQLIAPTTPVYLNITDAPLAVITERLLNSTSSTMMNLTTTVTSGLQTSPNMSHLNVTSATPVSKADDEMVVDLSNLSGLSTETWVVLLQEALVYLLVLCRWLLPKQDSKEEVSVLLLEFLAISSDIMELLAVFDSEEVRSDLGLTIAVMTIWSISFVQFVPSLSVRGHFRSLHNAKMKHIFRACGEQFVEIVGLCMGIFLQDGPFMVLRLYIMIALKLFTYSLAFFVLKNIVTVLLLSYRLGILAYKSPCCLQIRKRNKFKEMTTIREVAKTNVS